MTEHPFLQERFLISWSRLTPDRVKPDIERALREARERIDAIAARSGELTFENTLLALDKATERLSEAWGKVSHLNSVCDSPSLRGAYNEMLPEVSEFFAGLPLDEKLWRVIRDYAATEEAAGLAGVRRRFLDETLADFRQAGADLPPEQKKRMEAIESELSALTQKYSENVLDATNAWELVIEDEAQLAGLPANAKEAARHNALAKGLGSEDEPRWRFTLHVPSFEPFMTYIDDSALRRRMWEAAVAVGAREPHDNTEAIGRILALREEKARILGRDSFASLVLERRMAKSSERALEFVEDLHRRSRAIFARENRELEDFYGQNRHEPSLPLEPWDLLYWSEKQRRATFDFDEEDLRPYFPIDRVIGGLFEIAERIFEITIREREDVVFLEPGSAEKAPEGAVEVWHSEVRFYEVRDRDGRHLGSFYADWHPRESKRGGAWFNPLSTGGPAPGGERHPHLGLICGNLTPSVAGKPALLTHREVETIFHEFGHLLHHLFGEVEIKSLNGVSVPWDFVELPSQIMENWCWDRESLNFFARHHETGAPIPDGLFAKMLAARNYRSANATMRQLSFARLDLELHARYPHYADGDFDAVLRKVLADYVPPTRTPLPTIIRRFGHLFSSPTGYAAGYYSYKWSEVLDADAFTRFQAEGVLNPKVGREFADKILSKGNSEDPLKLYVDFMGREPDLLALLKRAGLVAE